MLIRALESCAEFIAGDKTCLREILHGAKDQLALGYSLAHASVAPGAASTPHLLKTSEVYYILSGEGTMHIGDESSPVQPGDTVYIPPDAVQWIENSGASDLTFLCIVDPAWRVEDEIVLGDKSSTP